MTELFPHDYWIKKALEEAKKAYLAQEVPVGALIVYENRVIAKAHNQVELLKDATAHAEILAITSASQYFHNWRLDKTTLYVTKEPCVMCAGAIIQARIPKVVFSAYDEKDGAGGSRYDILREHRKWKVEVISGIGQKEGEHLLNQFFSKIRNN